MNCLFTLNLYRANNKPTAAVQKRTPSDRSSERTHLEGHVKGCSEAHRWVMGSRLIFTLIQQRIGERSKTYRFRPALLRPHPGRSRFFSKISLWRLIVPCQAGFSCGDVGCEDDALQKFIIGWLRAESDRSRAQGTTARHSA